jgi:AcrR family transcriptional regulator
MRKSQEGRFVTGRGRGRPAVDSGTREAILEAARVQFGELGYGRTTLRGVARRAGVDPRLVLHYFGSKAGLFQASVTLPVDPTALAADVFGAGPELAADRAAERFIGMLEDEATRRGLLALLRAAVADPEAARSIRAVLAERVLRPMAGQIAGDQPERRAAMMGSLLVGLAVARNIVGIEALASMSPRELSAAIGPVIRHYLGGDWTNSGDGEAS